MSSSSKPTIGLCMIVRDEEAVIERCIESARPLISGWTICDTGSRDRTPELVADRLADLPGELHRRPWVDFGTNRSELMELAQGSADYLLLLDADMTVEQLGELPEMHADAYLLRHAGSFSYAVHRLVRGDRRWRFEGATHEYMAADEPFEEAVLEELVVHHHADGGSRGSKLERDRRLLSEALERDPDDPRALFYLAQTHRDRGETEEAIELYLRRAALGGWDQEAFYARFQAGALLAQVGRDREAVGELVAAYRARPSRAEPLLVLARLCRAAGRYLAAYRFARRGLALPVPGDVLFVHRDAYEWGLLFELAIAAYWIGEPGQGLRACDRLLSEGKLPEHLRGTVEENRAFCADSLAAAGTPAAERQRVHQLAELAPSCRFAELTLEVDPPWPSFNPSIAAAEDGFRTIVRTASYRYLAGGRYLSLDREERIRTINYLAELDRDLSLRSVAALSDEAGGTRNPEAVIVGYEDMRLIETSSGTYATATVADRNADGRLEMALLRLDGERIVGARLLRGPDPGRHERNWMPLVRGDELLLVYSLGPTVVYRCDLASAELTKVAEHPAPDHARGLRGGSQGLRIDGAWLFCAHEVLFSESGRHYVHRLVRLDDELRLSALSPRFRFAGENLEFCAGLARRGDELILSFGVGDAHAGLAVCPERELLDLLEKV
jgi:tetratricopeptide (TPR) repeat protein